MPLTETSIEHLWHLYEVRHYLVVGGPDRRKSARCRRLRPLSSANHFPNTRLLF
jgi:hypothetical protein